MAYSQRLATPEDRRKLALLWRDFASQRAQADPSLRLKPDFDYERYVKEQLKKALSYGFVLEYGKENSTSQEIVGFLFAYVYDEAPPTTVTEEWDLLEGPFRPRRVGSVLGLYVVEEHRQLEAIQLLVEAAMGKAEELKITDIDLLISREQAGIQALLERGGFTKAAIQYTKHYEVLETDLPSLHPPHPQLETEAIPPPGTIPLREPKTKELVNNPQGKPVYLSPISDDAGNFLKTSNGLPIYPTPLRDPQTQDWVFDEEGNLVVCPVLQDETGQVVEYMGIPQFCPPLYERVVGKLQLKRDRSGNYLFAEVERDGEGKIRRSPAGKPVFKP